MSPAVVGRIIDVGAAIAKSAVSGKLPSATDAWTLLSIAADIVSVETLRGYLDTLAAQRIDAELDEEQRKATGR